MSLQKDLNDLKSKNKQEAPKELQEQTDRMVSSLEKDKKAEGVLLVGDKAPNFTLKDALGKNVTLSQLLVSGPVIINFYRGGWCPYCNMELRALQNHLDEFKKYNAQLVAISSERPDSSLTTVQKNKLDFHVLSDHDSKVANTFGVAYDVPEYLIKTYEKFGMDLSQYHDNPIRLALPASLVIGKDGKILYLFACEDFTKRADVNEILNTLKKTALEKA